MENRWLYTETAALSVQTRAGVWLRMRKTVFALAALAPFATHAADFTPDEYKAGVARMNANDARSHRDATAPSAPHARKPIAMECTYPYGGQLCRRTEWPSGSFGEYIFSAGGSPMAMLSVAMIDRIKTRCLYESRVLFVNDALRTHQEIFDGCMRYDLTVALP
jgi:hypothetical protein